MQKRSRGRNWKPPSLDGVRIKVDRAKVHDRTVNGEIQQWDEAGVYTWAAEVRDDGHRHIWRAVNPPANNPQWSAMVGDCVHNLRSALDHLAWQLVRLSGTDKPQPNFNFPIYDHRPGTRKGWWPWSRKFPAMRIARYIKPEMFGLIDGLQPYHGTESGERLRLIGEINNFDKHRDIIVVAGSVHMATTGGDIGPGAPPLHDRARFTELPVEHNQVIAELFYTKRPRLEPDPNLNFQPFISTYGEPLGKDLLGPLLGKLCYFVEDELVPLFAGFFPAGERADFATTPNQPI
jgi:hypothetical protein